VTMSDYLARESVF